MRGITDPTAKQWWRDYLTVVKEGNPLGLSFVEYVAHRVISLGTQLVYDTRAEQTPWYVSTCGHRHQWGESCGSWTAAQ